MYKRNKRDLVGRIENYIEVADESGNGAEENKPHREWLAKLRQSAGFNYLMLILLGVSTGLSSLLLGAAYYGLPMFFTYFASPAILLLNILPPVLLILLVYFISGRAWISFTLPSLTALVLTGIEFFKMQLRGDPFVAADMALAAESGAIVSEYSLTMNWKIYVVLLIFICGVVFSALVLRRRIKNPAVRIAGVAAALTVSSMLSVYVYMDTDIYEKTRGGFEPAQWSHTENYIARGFLYPFIHSIRYAFPEKPDGYHKSDAETLLDVQKSADIPAEKKVNIVSIMLEAYIDLSVFEALDFEYDVYKPLHKLQNESVSGNLVTNIYGGGTIDTERLFLTGYTRLTSFSYKTNSFIYYFKKQGYYTEGIHAGDGWFYDRNSVNKHLGFDNYYFLEDYEKANREDSFFFPAVRDLYDSRDKEKPYFSYSLSYQNHGAYESQWTEAPYFIAQEGLSDEAFCILNNYLSGIYKTTLWIERFIDTFREESEPAVIVIFGDHKPWLGNNESVYHELGINIDVSTPEGFYNLYSTPYIIWANKAAKAVLDNDFTGEGGSFSPCFLMNEVFRLCSWDGDSYMQALRGLMEYTDIINTPTGLFRENGELTPELSEESKNVWNDFRKIEYYRWNNFEH